LRTTDQEDAGRKASLNTTISGSAVGNYTADIDITDAAAPKLPPMAGCGPDERIVRIPRNLLVNAKRDIPH